jgi:dihydroorotate dehydrogenase
MRLLGTEFGNVFNASGARNFDGRGYWYSRLTRQSWRGSSFIAKTTTLEPRKGNMPVYEDGITPVELVPKCIKVNFRTGEAINAVGLTGPGALTLLRRGMWQCWSEGPFFISFMAVELDPQRRLEELLQFVNILTGGPLGKWSSPAGLQVNFSCPNVGLDVSHLLGEVEEALEITSCLRTRYNIPVVPKFNPLTPATVIQQVARHRHCDAISITNTIPWGSTPAIGWHNIFSTSTSPLASFGGGGYSGPQALPLVIKLLEELMEAGVEKPLIGGNGIQSPDDAWSVMNAGATAIELGTIAMLRPHRLQPTIQAANEFARADASACARR